MYSSDDGVTLGSMVGSVRIENAADLTVGSHSISVELSGAPSGDQYLLTVADSLDEVSESNETNNQLLFEGGVFLGPNDEIHVHGTDAADTVAVSGDTTLEVDQETKRHKS